MLWFVIGLANFAVILSYIVFYTDIYKDDEIDKRYPHIGNSTRIFKSVLTIMGAFLCTIAGPIGVALTIMYAVVYGMINHINKSE